jgi:hypothetical protein
MPAARESSQPGGSLKATQRAALGEALDPDKTWQNNLVYELK